MATKPRDILAEGFIETRKQLRGLWLKLWGGGFFIVILGFMLAWMYIEPAPPSRIVIAAGPADGAYYQFANSYREQLKRHGVDLEIRVTAGSLENYQLLLNDPEIDLAIVQGGTAPPAARESKDLEAIGSLYLEPIWVFYRDDEISRKMLAVNGQRIAVGEDMSGTQMIARTMLAENGITEDEQTSFLSIGGDAAVKSLQAGTVDAAFFVLSPDSHIISDLLATPDVKLMSLSRQQAIARRHQFLKAVTLRQGVVDLEEDLPRSDVQLVAPAANLVATRDFHDSLVPVLLRAATVTHHQRLSLVSDATFPSTDLIEFPLNESARLYYDHGPPFLQKYLPFWIASGIDRGKVLLLPLIALMLPLFKVAPPIYRWRIRSRIYRWYKVLRGIEGDTRRHESLDVLSRHLETLEAMEQELDSIDSVPLAYMEEFYNLRLHVEFVDRRVRAEEARRNASDTADTRKDDAHERHPHPADARTDEAVQEVPEGSD